MLFSLILSIDILFSSTQDTFNVPVPTELFSTVTSNFKYPTDPSFNPLILTISSVVPSSIPSIVI